MVVFNSFYNLVINSKNQTISEFWEISAVISSNKTISLPSVDSSNFNFNYNWEDSRERYKLITSIYINTSKITFRDP